jgi:hypothetical protein
LGKKSEDSPSITDMDELEKTRDDLFARIQDDIAGNQSFGYLIGNKEKND